MSTTTTFRHGIACCPGCQTDLIAPLDAAGRVVRCKECGTRFSLPDAEELFEAAVAHLLVQEEERAEDSPDLIQQIQSDTMVRDEQAANPDFAWLG